MLRATASAPPPPPRVSRARGFTRAQLVALGEVVKLCERAELIVQLRGGLDGTAIVTVRDRWAVEHYRIDSNGVLTRPVPAGARQGVPQV